jgi:carboxypeptidase D
MIYDPSTSYTAIQEQIPANQFVDYWYGLMPFNDSFSAQLHNMSDSCGYTDFLNTYLQFPPPGPLPTQLPGTDEDGNLLDGCDIFDAISNEVFYVNPCWDIYQVATTCPMLWDVLGFPGTNAYLPEGATIYFNRTDVQEAINAPIGNWEECSSDPVFVNNTDTSPPSGVSVLAGVIERSKRTVIGHGVSYLDPLQLVIYLLILAWKGS